MDTELIARYQAGDEAAFEELVAGHLKGVYSFVAQYVGSEEEAEDITQDTFFKAWKSLAKFDATKASFKTWIMQIARNTAVDFLRKKKHVPFSSFENAEGENVLEESLVSDLPGAEEEFFKTERATHVQKAIQELSLQHREILLFYLENDMTFTEIGAALGVPPNSAKSRYRRALLALKGILHQTVY